MTRNLCCLVLLLSASTFVDASGFTFRKVVETGDDAEGINGFFDSIVLEPVINNNGVVAFSCRLFGTEELEQDNEALIIADESGWHIVALEGQPAPNGDGVYGSLFPIDQPVFYWPAINDNDQVIAKVGYINFTTPFSHSGLISATLEGVSSVARLSEATPAGTSLFDTLPGAFDGINTRGTTAFIAGTIAGGSDLGEGVFRWSNGSLEQVIHTGDVLPGTSETIIDIVGTRPGLGGTDTMTFKVLAENAEGVARERMLLASATGIVILSTDGEEAPGGGTYTEMGLGAGVTAMNSVGGVAFRAGISNPPFFETRVMRGSASGLSAIAVEDSPSPDGDGSCQTFLDPQSNDAGHVALVTAFEFEAGFATDIGIIRDVGSGWEVVLRTGYPLPAGTGTMGEANLGTPQMNASGTVAAIVGIADTVADVALVYSRAGEPAVEILRSGDVLAGREVASLVMPFNNDPGGRSSINDAGAVVFVAYFEDGTQGVYVAEAAGTQPVPAVSAWGVTVMALLILIFGTICFLSAQRARWSDA